VHDAGVASGRSASSSSRTCRWDDVVTILIRGYSSAGVGISRAGVESSTGVGSTPAKLYALAQHMPKVSYDENNYAYIVRAFR